jgi:hypothetical protein
LLVSAESHSRECFQRFSLLSVLSKSDTFQHSQECSLINYSPLVFSSMVAFSRNDLPDSVNSVEKLIVWAETLLQNLCPEVTAIEVSGSVDRIAISQPWFIQAANPPTWRVISRSSIPVSSQWQRSGKLWVHAVDVSAASIPAEFKSN